MAASRFWRAVGLQAYGGGDAELSAVQLYEGSGDANYSQVSLLLHGEGPNGSTSIVDSSPAPKVATAYSGVSISTGMSKYGEASIFGGNALGARVMIPPHADLDMGSGDFTVELWVYKVATSGGIEYLLSHRMTTGYHAFHLYIDIATGLLEFSICNTSKSIFRAIDSAVFPAGRWVHVAGVRLATTIRLFVDGVERASTAVSGAVFGPGDPTLLLGTSDGDSRFKFNGYLDEVRITKGVARYTTDFAPPSSVFPNSASGSFAARVDQLAVLTSTLPPVSGSIAALQDDNMATIARLAAREPGFALQWDFGVGEAKNISAAAIGSSADTALFLSHFDLQSSTDAKSWQQEAFLGRYPWPGANNLAPYTSGNLPPLARTPIASVEVVASAPVSVHSTLLAARLQLAREIEFGGPGLIWGTTKTEISPDVNVPTKARVVLLHQRSNLPVRTTWSNATTGVFEFAGIDTTQQFIALAEDALGNYRPVAANKLTPEVAL